MLTNHIKPTWLAPPNVRALTTVRQGGLSIAPYYSFNVGDYVGDDPNAVLGNKALLRQQAELPQEPLWLRQVHGMDVVDAGQVEQASQVTLESHNLLSAAPSASGAVEADASFTDKPGVVCAILTADCLPILLCDRAGTHVAAIHAGWRGLASGVIDATIARWSVAPQETLVWLGPAIGPTAFEVSDEVVAAFEANGFKITDTLFKPKVLLPNPSFLSLSSPQPGKFLGDLYGLARQRLTQLGVADDAISGGDYCTLTQADLFYSYRRETPTGRMASLIWLV